MSNSVSDWSLGNTDMGCTLYSSPEISVATKKRLRYGENAESQATVLGWCPGICISNHRLWQFRVGDHFTGIVLLGRSLRRKPNGRRRNAATRPGVPWHIRNEAVGPRRGAGSSWVGGHRTMWLGRKSLSEEEGIDDSYILLHPCLRDLRASSPAWDSHKMEKPLWASDMGERCELGLYKDIAQRMLISLTNTTINSHSRMMFRGYSWAKSNQGLWGKP